MASTDPEATGGARPRGLHLWARYELPWLAGLAVAMLAVWHYCVVPPPSSMVQPEGADLFFYFLPSYAYEASRLRAGALPMWNPYQAAGLPFLATLQPAVLYPARLLFLFLDVPTAMCWSTIGHLLLTALATFACCRAVGSSRAGAAVGGGVMAIAFSLPNMFWPSYMETGTWLPIAALAFTRVAGGGGFGWIALLGVAAGMPLLAGGYQLAMYFPYGLAVFALAVACDARWRGRVWTARTLGAIALAGVLALATAAPQLLPTLAWTSETARRAAPLSDAQIGLLSRPWKWFYGTVVPGNGWQPAYLSAPVVLLAVAGFVTRGAFGATLGVGALFFYLLSLGAGTPFFPLYRWIPGFALFRFPQRLMTLVVFLAAVGAALGVTSLGHAHLPGMTPRRSRPWLELAALVAVAVALVLPLRNLSLLPWTASPAIFDGPPGLYSALEDMNHDGRTVLPPSYMPGLAFRQGTMRHMRVLQDYEPLSSRRLAYYLHAVAGLPPPRDDGYIPFAGNAQSLAIERPQLLDLVAVRSIVRFSIGPAAPTPPFVPAKSVASFRIYRNPGVPGRAWLVREARFVETEPEALAAMLAPAFDGRTAAVLVGAPDAEASVATTGAREERAQIVVDEPERVVVEVAVEAPRLLVLADAFAPGWAAAVDGTSRRIWQANYLVRGVFVRPGDRRVEFRYRAPGFREGVIAAAVAWGLVGLAVVVLPRRAFGAGGAQ